MKQIKLFTIIAFIILGNLATVQAQAKVDIDGDEGANTTSQNVDWDRVMALRKQISDANVQLGNLAQTLWKNGDPVSAIINSFEPTAEEKLNAINEYLSKNKTTFNTFKNVSDKIAKLRYEECSLQRDCGSFQDYKSKNGIRNISSNRYSAILLAKKEWESKAQSSGNSGNKSNNSSDFYNRDSENKIENNTSNQLNDTYNKINKTNAAYDKLGDEVGAELGEIFSGELKPQNIMNITESILNSGLLKTIDGIGAVSIGGGVLAAGVGLLQEAKQDKIKSKANSLKENIENYKSEYKNFKTIVDENKASELIESHNKLYDIESLIIGDADYLINKAKQTDLRSLSKNIDDSREKRIEGMKNLKNKLFANFDNISNEQREFVFNSGLLSENELEELKPDIALLETWNPNSDKKYYHTNGSLWIYKGKSYYPSGKIERIYKPNPYSVDFYRENGTLSMTSRLQENSSFEDGKLIITRFNSEEQIESKTETFDTDGLARKVTEYYPNSEIKKQGNYNSLGKPIGLWEEFDKNGKIRQTTEFLYIDNKEKTISKIFDENGLLTSKETIIINTTNFETDRELERYHSNGNVFIISKIIKLPAYNELFRNGITKWFYKNGQLRQSIRYKIGYNAWKERNYEWRDEVIESYDINGKPIDGGTLKDGKGTIHEYDENGNLTRSTKYRKGKLIKESNTQKLK